MTKRKIRINGMDVVILTVIAAAVLLLLYVFVWSAGEDTAETEYVDLVYVVEVMSLDGQFQNSIQAGQPVLDAVKRGSMGTVQTTPQVVPMKVAAYDEESGQEVYNEVPGKYRMSISIEAKAAVSPQAYTVGGTAIYVGEKLSLVFPNMKCDGYCVDLMVVE